MLFCYVYRRNYAQTDRLFVFLYGARAARVAFYREHDDPCHYHCRAVVCRLSDVLL